MMEIKKVTRADISRLSELVMREFPYTGLTKEALRERLRNRKIHLFKMVECSEMAGFIEVEEDGCLGRINAVAVTERFRGQKIGERLVSFAVDFLKARGAKEIRLIVKQGNRPAKGIYSKAGFKSIGLLEREIDGSPVEEMHLETAQEAGAS